MKPFALVLTIILWVSLGSLAAATHEAYVVYESPADRLERSAKRLIQRSDALPQVISLINDRFVLPKPLPIIFGGTQGPLYDGQRNEIYIPYGFIGEVKARFRNDNYAETGISLEDATLDVLMHTLFHELGHALIVMYDLPVLGKEEDAADGLASVLLIEDFTEGADIALSAADLFSLEGEDVNQFTAEDFWDEHSLDEQRFFSTLCHIYGSDPENYADLPRTAGFPDDRADLCIDEYHNLERSWNRLLKPYLKPQ